MKRALALLVSALWPAGPAAAQSALYLVPERATVALGDSVRLAAATGVDPDAAPGPWPAERIEHFFARTAWTQENRDGLGRAEGSEVVAPWRAAEPGVLLLGIELADATESVPAASFAAFVDHALGETGRAAIGEVPAGGEVALVRRQSAKAVVVVESAGAEPASIATSKAGQAVEIRPLMDPVAARPGSDLAVRLHASIPGAAGGVVIATNTVTGDVVRATADSSSIANVPLGTAGRWRLEFHAVARSGDETARARFEVHTATLTFDVRPEGEQ
ncbi:MAG TPA: hypothetical protein VFF69_08855 [Phycisphaerales bacterium]|nr:hypothetical protein [Phycisphaerales bacterium]